MKVSSIFLQYGAAVLFVGATAFPGFAQVQVAPSRIPQQIVINGQPANGAYVPSAGGGMQAFTCTNPQHYTTADGASQGWACYDQRSATYLLNALPPSQTQAAVRPAYTPAPLPQNPAVVYGQAYPARYPVYGFPRPQLSGKVKIDTKLKDAKVYVDGGFAGSIRNLKKFSLSAGNHEIELRDSRDETIFKEQVQVIPRKTIEVKPVSKS